MTKRKGESNSNSRKRAKRTPKEYPDDLPSRTLTPAHTDWLTQFQDEYTSHIGRKGSPDGAFSWVRSELVDKFLKNFFPGLAEAQREAFRPWIGTSINSRLNNRANKPNIIDPTAIGKVPSSGMYLWSRDHQTMVDDTWGEACIHNPKLINNPGQRRAHVSKLWKELTPDEQLPYKMRFLELKQEATSKVIPDEEKQKFLDKFVRKISTMARNAERMAGVFFEARVAVEVGGVLTIKQVGSPLGDKYLASDAGGVALTSMQDWIGDRIGSLSRTGDPPIAVTPIREDHMRPSIPDISKHQPVLQLLRSMARTGISGFWHKSPGLGHWFDLPTRTESDTEVRGPLLPAEFELLDKALENAPAVVPPVVDDLMKSVNVMESKFPVWTANGLWAKVDGQTVVPNALPFNQPTSDDAFLVFWLNCWLTIEYFQRARPGFELSRLDYVESFIQDEVLNGIGFHDKSGTLIGGKNGVVWAARCIVKIILNILAVMDNGGVKFDTPLPPGYDPKRLGSSHLELALEWAKDLTVAIKKSTDILAASWSERCIPADLALEPTSPPSTLFPFDDTLFDDALVASSTDPKASSSKRATTSVKASSSKKADASHQSNVEEFDIGDSESGSESGSDGESEGELEGIGKGGGKRKGTVKGKGKGKVQGKAKGKAKSKGKGKGSGQGKETRNVAADESEKTSGKGDGAQPLSEKAQKYVSHHLKYEQAWQLEREAAAEEYSKSKREGWTRIMAKPRAATERLTQEQREAAWKTILTNWTDKTSIFDEPPTFEPTEPCDVPPEKFQEAVDEFIVDVTDPMQDWANVGKEWTTTYSDHIIDKSIWVTRFNETDYPHLVYSIALHGNLVYDSRDLYLKAYRGDRELMHKSLGIGSALLRRGQILQEAGQLPNLPGGILNHLQGVVWRIRHLHTQYLEREALAVRWRNTMRDRFRHPKVKYSLEELIEVATNLERWADEAEELYRQQNSRMLEEWVAARCTGFRRQPMSHFTYGNPVYYGFDTEAKEPTSSKPLSKGTDGQEADMDKMDIDSATAVGTAETSDGEASASNKPGEPRDKDVGTGDKSDTTGTAAVTDNAAGVDEEGAGEERAAGKEGGGRGQASVGESDGMGDGLCTGDVAGADDEAAVGNDGQGQKGGGKGRKAAKGKKPPTTKTPATKATATKAPVKKASATKAPVTGGKNMRGSSGTDGTTSIRSARLRAAAGVADASTSTAQASKLRDRTSLARAVRNRN
ncbi:hypothetical protein FRC07_006684 [Ceratobasidium sp. 392]|nr:hypothetical protein FRC07_006684 [Ceratobasidium sp. 392]